MLLYSQRHKIAYDFEKDCEKNGYEKCFVNMVEWLQSNGMLDEEKAKQHLGISVEKRPTIEQRIETLTNTNQELKKLNEEGWIIKQVIRRGTGPSESYDVLLEKGTRK